MATKTAASQRTHDPVVESGAARLLRVRDEVRSGRYRVDADRLALCILASSASSTAARVAGRPLDERLSC
jgi:anti-sigma28 factor (negative regulator of flagellin synthesis)